MNIDINMKNYNIVNTLLTTTVSKQIEVNARPLIKHEMKPTKFTQFT